MRAFMVMMFVLCVLGGLYLLLFAPEFLMPAQSNLASGRQFGAGAARTLGAALITLAVLAAIFLHHQHVSRLPGLTVQKIYFALILLALVLFNVALNLAVPG
jgi:hypothetical protein